MTFASQKTRRPKWPALAGSLVLLMLLSSSGFARGPKGGGAAGALGDFDLAEVLQVTAGLPANLVNGFAPAGTVAGDGIGGTGGSVGSGSGGTGGSGGIPLILPGQPGVISQGGQAVTLLPAGVNGSGSNGGPRAGVLRQVGPDGLPPMRSLKSVGIPPVPGLSNFIRDRQAAIVLGKALFWDIQAGSDGNSCASCHFHAGADNRLKNQLSPGLKAGDTTFQATFRGAGGPNYTLKPGDFPFHRLKNPLDRNSEVTFDSNDVASSSGAFGGAFTQLGPNGTEVCGDRTAPDSFNVKGVLTRRVAPRNAPTTINAVFNYRNFWDGRANNAFNGVNPFGPRDPNAKVLEHLPDGSTVWTAISLPNASLASQATGPALSEFEMSCANRTFMDLGRKLLALKPLRLQEIHPQDSVLGDHRDPNKRGLQERYPDLIRAAFDPRWWSASGRFNGYSQMESNFSLFWGLAIMMYESTLVSDETPFDKFVGTPGSPAKPDELTTQQLRGLGVFRGKGQCIACHKGAEFTGAATTLQPDGGEGTVVESMFLKTGELAIYDNGFYNIGVRPAAEDRGVGATDPFGNPLSFSRSWFDQLRARPVADPVMVDPCLFSIFFNAAACWVAPDADGTRIVAEGAFKTPTLRNVALTQPYFHNGSRFTLEQVVEFYNRGGDRRGPDDNDTTGFVAPDAPNGGTTNLHPAMNPLGLSKDESADLVAFLRFALTDPRVACEREPFDHPSLPLHNGHVGNANAVRDSNHNGHADDQFETLPAVGRWGHEKEHCLRNDDGSLVAGLPDTEIPPPPPPSAPPPTPTGPTSTAPTPAVPTPAVPTPAVPTPAVPTPAVPTPTVPTPTVPTPTGPAPADPTPTVTTPTPQVPTPQAPATPTSPAPTAAVATASILAPSAAASPAPAPTVSAVGTGLAAADSGGERSTINGAESNKGPQASSTTEHDREKEREPSQSGKSDSVDAPEHPRATINASDEILVGSRVTIYGSVSTGATFAWAQIAGPTVKLSGTDTLAPSFTAPTTPATLSFQLTATNGKGLNATVEHSVTAVPDNVKLGPVTWSKRQGKGELSLVAASSAITSDMPAPPPGMTMNVTFWNRTVPPGQPGSATNPIKSQMKLVKDVPGLPPVCASKLPCFSAVVPAIVDPKSPSAAPQFIPPTTVAIQSSLGGSGIATGADILIR